ncbi:hypothetical protein D9615_004218 [Tricholomella constricta]|uniref:HNH endonuclease n=1 Tax=Tricholomella constricta TaxID=117010 RepID=A0A8H5HF33_9AGAR|nr:hypothetical protein D9615_004218 [Tricholomella constricta]
MSGKSQDPSVRSGDSQASSVGSMIRHTSGNRCAICLNLLPETGLQAAHLIDSAEAGVWQLAMAVRIGLLTSGYQRSSAENGMAQCPTCHQAYFTPDLIALSPSLPVLNYILDYVNNAGANRRPLHEVFSLLRQAMTGAIVALPDPAPILPFLGLFSIVILKPEGLVRRRISTQHLPALSILQDNRFMLAPDGTPPEGANVARIFDVLATGALDPVPVSQGMIPLSAEDPEFRQRRYWRLTVLPEAILTALMARNSLGTFRGEEIDVATRIYHILSLEAMQRNQLGPAGGGGPGDGGGPGHGGGPGRGGGRGRGRGGRSGRGRGGSGGGGPSGDNSSPQKRTLRSTNREPPRKKGREGGQGKKKGGLRSGSLEAVESGLGDTRCEDLILA